MKKFFLGVVVGLMAAAALFPVAHAAISPTTTAQLDLFVNVLERIEQNYVHDVELPKLMEAAIDGMMSALDSDSVYLNSGEVAEVVQLQGNAGTGIGLEISASNGLIRVTSPIPGSPAASAGIRPGDVVLDIDGQPTQGLQLHQAIKLMKGAEGSAVVLTVVRNDTPMQFRLRRARVTIPPLAYEKRGDVGYVRIFEFNEQTERQLKRAVVLLKQQIGPNLKGYILDLRDNPGGIFGSAIAVSDDFLESGSIVELRGRTPENNKTYSANPGDIADGKPIEILINEGTAAGSEIVAGSLQDNHRSIVLGIKSAGSGTIQTIIPVPGGSMLKLTTAEFYLPTGRAIQGAGIEPDILVSQDARPNDASNVAGTTYPDPQKKYDDFQLSYALDRLNGK
jgi:carboxyl-terminal processing protease